MEELHRAYDYKEKKIKSFFLFSETRKRSLEEIEKMFEEEKT